MKIIKLSDRLKVLADLIEKGASVVDVGTDHGYLPVYLAQTGTVKSIIATDISPASLKAAQRTVRNNNLSDTVKLLVTSGLDGITDKDVDTIVISGMGGEMILYILENASWTNQANIRLILQPQSKLNTLCRFLYNNGYEFDNIKTVVDKKKNYIIIVCKGTKEF